jgi:hypothetical protein
VKILDAAARGRLRETCRANRHEIAAALASRSSPSSDTTAAVAGWAIAVLYVAEKVLDLIHGLAPRRGPAVTASPEGER